MTYINYDYFNGEDYKQSLEKYKKHINKSIENYENVLKELSKINDGGSVYQKVESNIASLEGNISNIKIVENTVLEMLESSKEAEMINSYTWRAWKWKTWLCRIRKK